MSNQNGVYGMEILKKSLLKLNSIRKLLFDESKNKMSSLIIYIQNNKSHIVNYVERKNSNFVFTNQLAESTINNLVNMRQKQDKRMQWSRDGADAILHICPSKQSHDWENDRSFVQALMYREAVKVN